MTPKNSIAFITLAYDYLQLSFNSCDSIIQSGNEPFAMYKIENNEEPNFEYDIRNTNLKVGVSTVYNFYHGMELIVKGLAHLSGTPINTNKKGHNLMAIYHSIPTKFKSGKLTLILTRYFNSRSRKKVVAFFKENEIDPANWYQALRYPQLNNSTTIHHFLSLKKNGIDGISVMKEITRDIETIKLEIRKIVATFNSESLKKN